MIDAPLAISTPLARGMAHALADGGLRVVTGHPPRSRRGARSPAPRALGDVPLAAGRIVA